MAVMILRHNESVSTEATVYREDGSSSTVYAENNIHVTEEQPVDELFDVQVSFDIYKSNSDEGLVSGWANVAVNADGSLPLDWQDDVIAPETLEKAAINFMMDYRESGVMHRGDSVGVVVESIVFTKEKQKCLGIPEGTVPEGWFITVKVLDKEVFDKVKNGTYKMFSIQGQAKRVEL